MHLVYLKGFREKNHFCLLIALKELYVKTGKLKNTDVTMFEAIMELRHQADYSLSYNQKSAEMSLKYADLFIEHVKEIIDE